ncbi:peroxiredoxin-like family protein [Rhodococcus xishaensis]|uniref:AhpC/TSA family protein n=1 Tax=Rhodococcus xishaensis TaxID=2487364 RepID=A0A3S3CQ73_9NOCA|nr:peroxiredoxin-like family protein [Rhodococcus xishaensis]RVW03057.1 AhpC/TSA family protein [Rhodococcus xishaensis]
MAKLNIGDRFAPHRLETIDGDTVAVPSPDRLIHLQFRRYAGCPVCHLHLQSILRRYKEITAAGVTEVVVFHSAPEALRRSLADMPFAVVADPQRSLYSEVGVESDPTAIAHPRVWLAAALGAARQRSISSALGRGEDHFGKPADFLIASDGRILARKYGTHADDQWSVDEILTLADQLHSP